VRHAGDAASIGRIDPLHRAVRVDVNWSGANKQNSQKHESCDGSNAFHPSPPKVTVKLVGLKRWFISLFVRVESMARNRFPFGLRVRAYRTTPHFVLGADAIYDHHREVGRAVDRTLPISKPACRFSTPCHGASKRGKIRRANHPRGRDRNRGEPLPIADVDKSAGGSSVRSRFSWGSSGRGAVIRPAQSPGSSSHSSNCAGAMVRFGR
jgi:hypothetical protein